MSNSWVYCWIFSRNWFISEVQLIDSMIGHRSAQTKLFYYMEYSKTHMDHILWYFCIHVRIISSVIYIYAYFVGKIVGYNF